MYKSVWGGGWHGVGVTTVDSGLVERWLGDRDSGVFRL